MQAKHILITMALAALNSGALPATARADTIVDSDHVSGGGGADLPPYLQCVPYARQVSGIQIRGDAWTWWNQAEGHYARGTQPRVGAVMAFSPYGNMELGHVAAVSRIIDSRTVLLRHANWSPINGRRGQIEDNVRAIDVSPDNDWSQVRVWFAPIQGLGTTAWPVRGFIYPTRPDKQARTATLASMAPARAIGPIPALSGDRPGNRPENRPENRLGSGRRENLVSRPTMTESDTAYAADPIGAIIARRIALKP